jgi:hypothetical protein
VLGLLETAIEACSPLSLRRRGTSAATIGAIGEVPCVRSSCFYASADFRPASRPVPRRRRGERRGGGESQQHRHPAFRSRGEGGRRTREGGGARPQRS